MKPTLQKEMLEPVDQQYTMIGQIARAQGVDGTVLLIPEIYATTLFDDVGLVRLQNARGDLIPARIESVRVQEKNNRLSFFVKFDHISDRSQADAIKNFSVYVNRNKVSHLPEDTPAANFVSFKVIDENRTNIGIVKEVTDNPAHPILTVETSTGQLLVPLVDEYVNNIDEKRAVVYCQHLDQLSDL